MSTAIYTTENKMDIKTIIVEDNTPPHIHTTSKPALEEMISVPKAKLMVLLDRIKEYEENEKILADGCYQTMETLGFIDPATNKMYDEVKEGKNIFGRIIKTVKSKVNVTDYVLNRDKFENDLSEVFGFLKPMLDIGQKYADRKQHN